MEPLGFTYFCDATRGLNGDDCSCLALTSWMLTSCATTRPRQTTMMTPSQRIRRPIQAADQFVQDRITRSMVGGSPRGMDSCPLRAVSTPVQPGAHVARLPRYALP